MKLSLADQLAILYTRHGSQRKVAKAAGISRYAVSTILHNAAQGLPNTRFETRDDIVGGIGHAMQVQREELRRVAREHQIPYSRDIPVFAERLKLQHQGILGPDGKLIFRGPPDEVAALLKGKTVRREVKNSRGELTGKFREIKLTKDQRKTSERVSLLGDRVGVQHAHWLSDKLRTKWLDSQRKTGKYYAASIGSEVELPLYMKTARQRIGEYLKRGGLTTKERLKAEDQLTKLNRGFARDKIAPEKRITRVQTPYTSMDPKAIQKVFEFAVNEQLKARHASAIGENGKLASSILLQVDTRPNETKHGKARGGARGDSGGGKSRKARLPTILYTRRT